MVLGIAGFTLLHIWVVLVSFANLVFVVKVYAVMKLNQLESFVFTLRFEHSKNYVGYKIKWHSNTGPFGDLTTLDHFNTGLVCYSYPHR